MFELKQCHQDAENKLDLKSSESNNPFNIDVIDNGKESKNTIEIPQSWIEFSNSLSNDSSKY